MKADVSISGPNKEWIAMDPFQMASRLSPVTLPTTLEGWRGGTEVQGI